MVDNFPLFLTLFYSALLDMETRHVCLQKKQSSLEWEHCMRKALPSDPYLTSNQQNFSWFKLIQLLWDHNPVEEVLHYHPPEYLQWLLQTGFICTICNHRINVHTPPAEQYI